MEGGVELKVDISAYENMLKRLKSEDLRKALRGGFRRSASVLRKGIQQEIIASLNPHREGVKRWTKRGYFYPKPLHREVKLRMYRSVIGANVSLCNPRNPDNRAYVLRILNHGSVIRATKKGHNRGSLRVLNFFESGIDATKGKAVSDLNENIRKAVMKQVNK